MTKRRTWSVAEAKSYCAHLGAEFKELTGRIAIQNVKRDNNRCAIILYAEPSPEGNRVDEKDVLEALVFVTSPRANYVKPQPIGEGFIATKR